MAGLLVGALAALDALFALLTFLLLARPDVLAWLLFRLGLRGVDELDPRELHRLLDLLETAAARLSWWLLLPLAASSLALGGLIAALRLGLLLGGTGAG